MIQSELMPSPINQAEVNAIVWKACDTFRGTVEPSEYKNYILAILLLKYISDDWLENHSNDAGIDNASQHVAPQLSRKTLRLPTGSDFYSLYQKRNLPNLGEEINVALAAIEDANKEKLEGVFRNIDFSSQRNFGRIAESNEQLRTLLDNFNNPQLDLRPSRLRDANIVGNACKYLISKIAANSGNRTSEFYTPQEVSSLLAQLLDPRPGDRIYDPACGSGSLLITCAKQVDDESYSVWGQEVNYTTWALCMMNMLLNGMNVTTANIQHGNTLKEPKHLENDALMHFDVVVANPPFSLDRWGAENVSSDLYNRFWRGVPPKSNGDYAFISHMIESMDSAPGSRARMAVIVPNGVLFRGSSEGAIRKQLIDENLLDAVIGLPANLFFGTGSPAAILIFKRNRPVEEHVLFIDASEQFERERGMNRLGESDIERISSAYKKRASIPGFSRLVDLAEIAQNDHNLNVRRYIDAFDGTDIKTGFVTAWKGSHEVFLSYSRANTPIMNVVETALSAYGLRVWVDHSIEQGSASWQQTIQSAIETAFCVVVLLSPSSKSSTWVLKELAYADVHKKPIFPILIEGDLQESLPFILAGAQHTVLGDFLNPLMRSSNLRELAETILTKIGVVELPNFYRTDWQSVASTRGWGLTVLGAYTQILRGKSSQNEPYDFGEYPVYSANGMVVRRTSEYSFDGDYILIPSITRDVPLIRRVSGRFAATSNVYVVKPDPAYVNIEFLTFVLRMPLFGHLLQGAIVPSLRLSDLRNLPLPLPPLATQDEIVDHIQEQIEVTELTRGRLQTRLDILAHRPLGIIYQALTQEL